MFSRCLATVLGASESMRAISEFVLPRATQASTSRSRAVRLTASRFSSRSNASPTRSTISRRSPRRVTSTDTSLEAGRQAAGRIFGGRTSDRDEPTTWQTRQAQYDAVCTWGIPNHALLQRVAAIELTVFVANGDSDPMILPRYSHLLAGLLPDALVKIYPDSAHGFLFQHHEEFAADVHAFLEEAG